ncbi:atlastin-like isoform X2 [Bradysia coprophila]|uniref:atlastin-like isoform X2 n=1 Tax=Bradysia coprophila TaxID=38358 RepID=UPI00187DA785|nr:atlastin-like isoform X2 [Bradysia coprophila]
MHDVSGRAVQFINPTNNRLFEVDLDQLKSILEVDGIKDRNVVVVSVAGAVQCGKRFLLNFFIRYLHAQYKRHDMTEWMGNTVPEGYDWQNERKRKIVEIWMWSEIFTHDYENGDQVAIILLGTQGIFDDRTGLRSSSSIFNLTMMLSSVQCFNIMQNIRKDHLRHLRLVTEYGTFVSKRLAGKAFQKLIFLVRDWPNSCETGYGYHDQRFVDQMLATNFNRTVDMFEMRRHLAESFDKIGLFFMPHPGMAVLQKNIMRCKLRDINSEFLDYAAELSHQLFAPENLTMKLINGEKVRAGDFVEYFQSYVGVFKGINLPEMDTLYKATAEVMDSTLVSKCLRFYIAAMGKEAAVKNPYCAAVFRDIHKLFRIRATKMFQKNAKLGFGDKLARLENAIEKEFLCFKRENEKKIKMKVVKRTIFIAVVTGGIICSVFGHLGTLIGSWLGGFLALHSLDKDDKSETEDDKQKQR